MMTMLMMKLSLLLLERRSLTIRSLTLAQSAAAATRQNTPDQTLTLAQQRSSASAIDQHNQAANDSLDDGDGDGDGDDRATNYGEYDPPPNPEGIATIQNGPMRIPFYKGSERLSRQKGIRYTEPDKGPIMHNPLPKSSVSTAARYIYGLSPQPSAPAAVKEDPLSGKSPMSQGGADVDMGDW